MTGEPHLSAEAVALMLDGTLGPAERPGVVQHLAGCSICREELAALDRVLIPRRPWRMVGLGTLAVAALVLVMIWPRFSPFSGDRFDVETERGSPSTSATALQAYSPVVVAGRIERLTWSAAGRNTTYQVMIQDKVGTLLWQAETEDTTVRLPARFTLPVHGPVFWIVDALEGDGTLRTTGPLVLREGP